MSEYATTWAWSTPFTARYDGICVLCGSFSRQVEEYGDITVGELIRSRWIDGQVSHGKEYAHATCVSARTNRGDLNE